MSESESQKRFEFPVWANYLLPGLLIAAAGGALYVPVVAGLALNDETLNTGYKPTQPVPFSHAQHVGQLGMDCRYCHTTVDDAAFAAVPPTSTCINCHSPSSGVHQQSPNMVKVHESHATGMPIEWVKVHDLADHAHFNHAAHVNKGVGCVSCHGQIDQMEVVEQVEALSMGWCLDCHRAPEKHLRPREEVTTMDFTPAQLGMTQEELRMKLKEEYGIRSTAYLTNCSTCHR